MESVAWVDTGKRRDRAGLLDLPHKVREDKKGGGTNLARQLGAACGDQAGQQEAVDRSELSKLVRHE